MCWARAIGSIQLKFNSSSSQFFLKGKITSKGLTSTWNSAPISTSPTLLFLRQLTSFNHRLFQTLEAIKTEKIMSQKPNVVFVLGPPGSGKGTQCAKIVESFGFVHLSAGDLLREERNNPASEFGELIETHIRNGTIVPVEITCSLLENAMQKKQANGFNYFLIDGFPRSQNNLDGWTKQMSHKVNLLFVLFLTCAEEVCVGRCLGRGESGSGRSDDNPESLKKRIVTYNNETMPIINHYVGLDMVHSVDASPDAVTLFQEIRPFFESVAPSVN